VKTTKDASPAHPGTRGRVATSKVGQLFRCLEWGVGGALRDECEPAHVLSDMRSCASTAAPARGGGTLPAHAAKRGGPRSEGESLSAARSGSDAHTRPALQSEPLAWPAEASVSAYRSMESRPCAWFQPHARRSDRQRIRTARGAASGFSHGTVDACDTTGRCGAADGAGTDCWREFAIPSRIPPSETSLTLPVRTHTPRAQRRARERQSNAQPERRAWRLGELARSEHGGWHTAASGRGVAERFSAPQSTPLRGHS
jgi:hypothetical protein